MASQIVKVDHILNFFDKIFKTFFRNIQKLIYLHHADSFVKWAISIVGGVAVLLEKVVLDEPGDFERDFVVFGQGALADQLHDFLQIFLLLKNFFELGAKGLKLGKVGIIVFLKGTLVL